MKGFPTSTNGSNEGDNALQVGRVGTFEEVCAEGHFSTSTTRSTIEGARQKDESLSIEHSERRPLLLPSSEGFSGRRSLCTNRDLMELAGVLRGIHSRMIREGYRFENGEYKKP